MENTAVSQRVVEAADRLFYSRGIGQVGMDAVRAESGVSLKSIYRAFSSKEELIIAVLELRHEMWTTGLEATVAATDDPRERLLAVYDHLAQWFSEDGFRGCGFINAFAELGACTPRVAAAVRAHKASFQRYVDDLVAAAGRPATLGPQLAILAEGAQTTAAIAGAPDAATVARTAAAILIDAAT